MAENDLAAEGPVSSTATKIILVFLCISLYNVIELTFIIWGTFKRHSGLYFWSFVVATWGIPFYSGGFFVKYFAPTSLAVLAAVLVSVGWVAMITGQSMVLWSRLHLVLHDQTRLKQILTMIIVDAIVCHCATIPLIIGESATSSSNSSGASPWAKPYSIMEKIQVTVFFLQEIIISSFYIKETVALMKLENHMGNRKKSRRLMHHLVFVNAFIILLDMTILGLEYADQYDYQTSYKAFVYSTKLKLEFTILNRLVEMTTGKKEPSSGTHSRTGNKTSTAATGIALDTLFSETNANHKPRADFVYEAYAQGGEHGGTASGTNGDDGRHTSHASRETDAGNGVMMTTEIIVRTEERGEDDSRSVSSSSSSASSCTVDGGKGRDHENASKTSSEVHLATRGF